MHEQVDDSDSESDAEEKARRESQKKAFFDQNIKLPQEGSCASFEQLSLSRPLLKVVVVVVVVVDDDDVVVAVVIFCRLLRGW